MLYETCPIIAIIIAILLGVVLIPEILNSIDDTPSSVTIPETGIDWDNPPCSPSELSNDWVEVTPELMRKNSQRREFKHNQYC